MADIFISYARVNRTSAERLAEALEDHGWSVWWDPEIPAGKTFDDIIEKALEAAKSVVVLWSKHSIKSSWVRTEAAEGAERGVLVPVLIEEVCIPLAFKRIHAANLVEWDGKKSHPALQKLVSDIAGILGPPPAAVAEEQRMAAEQAEQFKAKEETAKREASINAKRKVDEEKAKKPKEETAKHQEEEQRTSQKTEPDNQTVINSGSDWVTDIFGAPATSYSATAMSGGLPTRLGKLNPLESPASGLLALLTLLNGSRSHPDPNGLKNHISREIDIFQSKALHNGVDDKSIHTASYVLCTVLDEAVLNTPWGNTSGWARQSLLNSFHKEGSDGELFFEILKSIGQNPWKNIDLLELMYFCMALGFEGPYRIAEDGKDKLAQIREGLYRLISSARGTGERTLSPHWEGIVYKRNPLPRFVPIWVIGATAVGILATVFVYLLIHLNHFSEPVFQQVYSIKATITRPRRVVPVVPPPISVEESR
jgi:type IV/VI secretion system ImpK/VasF family protein